MVFSVLSECSECFLLCFYGVVSGLVCCQCCEWFSLSYGVVSGFRGVVSVLSGFQHVVRVL